MAIQLVLFPVFVQVALTFALCIWMGYARRDALNTGETAYGDIALSADAWPPGVRQIGNCFRNQFELPMLFYVAVLLAMATRSTSYLFVTLAWIFVALRIAHAAVHTTTNDVPLRGGVFALGFLILVAMWIVLAIRVFLGVP